MYTTYHMMIIENPTKMRKVQLMPTMANVQKLISPSSEKNRYSMHPTEFLVQTWEVLRDWYGQVLFIHYSVSTLFNPHIL